MKWFFPSYAGDFRLEPFDPKADYRTAPKDAAQACVLRVLDPTPGETALLNRFLAAAVKADWTRVGEVRVEREGKTGPLVQDVVLDTTLAKAGTVLMKFIRPKDSTLTAVRYENGRIVTTSGTGEHAVSKLEAELAEAAKEELPPEEKPKTAVTVARPTPCCPECEPGAIEPASEVLLSFLTPTQHRDWAEHRAIHVRGHLSGHDYLVMHRNSPGAVRNGKLCYDLTDEARMDFHDVSVPPEEEVLAVKLILEHAEPWLRNEATVLAPQGSGVEPKGGPYLPHEYAWRRNIFQNPFGDGGDGTESASFVTNFGVGSAAMKLPLDVLLTSLRKL